MLARGTGALSLSDETRIYLVFGHPLHAIAGTITGVLAIDNLADLAVSQPNLSVSWIPSLTAGKSHSLSPADDVVGRLRKKVAPGGLSTEADLSADDGHMSDLGLRRLMSEQEAATAAQADPAWADVISSIAALVEGALHRHGAVLVESLAGAQPEARSILGAIQRSRSMPIRTVSPGRVSALLDEAEALVRDRMAAS